MPDPLRGEIWLTELDPVRGHEQAGRRPALVVSVDSMNRGPAGLVLAVPLTATRRAIPTHVLIAPPEGGVRKPSYIECEAIRSLARERLLKCWGTVSATTLRAVENRLRILLNL